MTKSNTAALAAASARFDTLQRMAGRSTRQIPEGFSPLTTAERNLIDPEKGVEVTQGDFGLTCIIHFASGRYQFANLYNASDLKAGDRLKLTTLQMRVREGKRYPDIWAAGKADATTASAKPAKASKKRTTK